MTTKFGRLLTLGEGLKCKRLSCHRLAFSFNTKGFAIVILVFQFLLSPFWTDWQSLFSNFSPIAALSACGQDQSYEFDMSCAFKSCPLEINSNGGLKQEHLESIFSATKHIILSLPQCIWPPTWQSGDLL